MPSVIVPKSYYSIKPERVKTTRFIQKPMGLMGGRALVPVKQSDNTNVIRMTKPYDVNHDGRLTKRDLFGGQIIGRSSSRRKPRQMVIKRFYKKKGAVRMHRRKFR